MLASLLTSAKQYFGDPIDCIGGKDVEKVTGIACCTACTEALGAVCTAVQLSGLKV